MKKREPVCRRCQKPMRIKRTGRKKIYCSSKCRWESRPGRSSVQKYGFGHRGSRIARNDASNALLPVTSCIENGGRASPRKPIDTDLWQKIIALEIGLPKPPPGMMTVVDRHNHDPRPSFKPAPNSETPDDSIRPSPANDNSERNEDAA